MRQLFLKYVASHIYDIYALLAGTLTLAIVMILKIPIKKLTGRLADQYAEKPGRGENRRKSVYKRLNGVLFVLVMAMGVLVFAITAIVSPQIVFSGGSAVLSGLIAIAEYEIIEQIF